MPTPRYAPQPIKEEFLIIGEGSADEALFSNLCSARGITGYQAIGLKGELKGTPSGTSGFQEYLIAIRDASNFENLKGVIIAADCDDKPTDRFNEIRKQLKKASYGEPNNPFQILKKRSDFPAVSVVMIPFVPQYTPQRGCLETMILQAVTGDLATKLTCIRSFCDCIDLTAWKDTNSAKLKLRCLVASCSPTEPEMSLARALEPSRNMIDLMHTTFDELSDFLKSFQTSCS